MPIHSSTSSCAQEHGRHQQHNPDIYIDEATYARLIPGKDIPQADMRTWTKFKTATAP